VTRIKAVAVGCSAGGIKALHEILPHLPASLSAPVIVVCHSGPSATDLLSSVLRRDCALPVTEAEERSRPEPGRVYVAPPDYHLLIEPDGSFAMSARPSIPCWNPPPRPGAKACWPCC
jgi:two-component system, chemotaxis family, protein-glutamate methylesterase/glutaminase